MSGQIEQTDVPSRIARRALRLHQSEPDNSGPDALATSSSMMSRESPMIAFSGHIDN